jgi:hypothetical protein
MRAPSYFAKVNAGLSRRSSRVDGSATALPGESSTGESEVWWTINYLSRRSETKEDHLSTLS